MKYDGSKKKVSKDFTIFLKRICIPLTYLLVEPGGKVNPETSQFYKT